MKSFFLPTLLLGLILPFLANCSLFETPCEETGTCDDGFSDLVRQFRLMTGPVVLCSLSKPAAKPARMWFPRRITTSR